MYVFTGLMFLISMWMVCQFRVHNESGIRDRKHLKQHLDESVDVDQMTDEELSFHYFKIHDTEDNDKLDGTELVQSVLHFHVEESEIFGFEARTFSDDELATIVDHVLRTEDKNSDGFIDYAEFVSGNIGKDVVAG